MLHISPSPLQYVRVNKTWPIPGTHAALTSFRLGRSSNGLQDAAWQIDHEFSPWPMLALAAIATTHKIQNTPKAE